LKSISELYKGPKGKENYDRNKKNNFRKFMHLWLLFFISILLFFFIFVTFLSYPFPVFIDLPFLYLGDNHKIKSNSFLLLVSHAYDRTVNDGTRTDIRNTNLEDQSRFTLMVVSRDLNRLSRECNSVIHIPSASAVVQLPRDIYVLILQQIYFSHAICIKTQRVNFP
jgi:hypothetical protein